MKDGLTPEQAMVLADCSAPTMFKSFRYEVTFSVPRGGTCVTLELKDENVAKEVYEYLKKCHYGAYGVEK